MNVAFYCPPGARRRLPLTAHLAVGFGAVWVMRDLVEVWRGDDEHVRLRRFEMQARKDPKHLWAIRFDSPLQDTTYVRQPDGKWLLAGEGPGFA